MSLERQNCHGMHIGISVVSEAPIISRIAFFPSFFLKQMFAQWKDKLNVVYEELVDGKPQYQNTKLGILRYYIKLNFFTYSYRSSNKWYVSGSQRCCVKFPHYFWSCIALCWAQSKCLINTCQSGDGTFKYLPLSIFIIIKGNLIAQYRYIK